MPGFTGMRAHYKGKTYDVLVVEHGTAGGGVTTPDFEIIPAVANKRLILVAFSFGTGSTGRRFGIRSGTTLKLSLYSNAAPIDRLMSPLPCVIGDVGQNLNVQSYSDALAHISWFGTFWWFESDD